MIKNLLKKLFLSATVLCTVGAAAAMSACNIETSHPEVKITVEFDSTTYELDYILYRNMYPNTVRHFMELSENGFYDNMVVHNYTSNDWFSGGYYYDADAYSAAASGGTGAMSEYLEDHSAEQSYLKLFDEGKMVSTVYRYSGSSSVAADDALPSLIGEFYNNIKQEIKQGSLSASYGSLKMFYYDKTTTEKVSVTPTSDRVVMADYKNNSATSLFMMQVGASSSYGKDDYCVFGRLDNTSVLSDLQEAVSEYLRNSDLVSANNVSVENDIEMFSDADRHLAQDFQLTNAPILIKSVKVTKY